MRAPKRTTAWLILLCIIILPLTAHAGLGGLLGLGKDKGPLPPEQAFPVSAEFVAADQIKVRWDTLPDYYLYKDKFKFELPGGEAAITEVRLPPGEGKDDPYFGRMEVYYGPVEARLLLDRAPASDLMLRVHSQGCADAGLCYPPQQSELLLTALPAGAGAPPSAAPTAPAPAAFAPVGELGELTALLSGDNLLLTLGGFFVAGLLLAFTACLYPMVPILSGLIAGDRHHRSGPRAFLLSLIYVEATAVTYAIAGVLAGISGIAVQADLQSPWVLGSFAALFVLLSLSMFGLYDLQLPNRWQTRINELSRHQKGGSFVGVAVMGVLSALIVGACSGPALIAALAFISSTGNAWLGGLALFTLANGMGVPLLLIGTAAGKWLPRSGPWMTAVKRVFGVAFLAVALWLLERLVPGHIALAMWGVLLMGCAVFLGALDRIGLEADHVIRLRKTGGLVLLLWGGLLLLGAAAGGTNFWQPLGALRLGQAEAATEPLRFEAVKDAAGLERALTAARSAGQPVMLDVYADWCVYCVQLERSTFPDPDVRAALQGARLLRVDVTAMSAADKQLLQSLDVFLPPAVIFYDRNGVELRDLRVVGFLPPEEFAPVARRATGGIRL